MPLINRIEVSNFMNSRRQEPWRPDWVYQVFNPKGENTAMNMPNGRGKSTMIGGTLGMLAGDYKVLNDIRQKHFSPASNGHFTHLRIEVTIAADDEAGMDLVAQSGGDFSGYRMVFGIYGTAGEGRDYFLYSYRGTFEDCPIGRRDGHRVTLIGNTTFLETLDALPSRFPTTRREGTLINWREHVGGIFDMASIEQQLVYQKAKGAEGSSNYFAVHSGKRPYSEAVFYERLAPELLVDMMGNIDEFAGERGIEDTIHEKVRNIIGAQNRTKQAEEGLNETRILLDELERVEKQAGDLNAAEQEAHAALTDASLAQAVIKNLATDDPLPGVPLAPPPGAPALARWMVMQDGEWHFADLGFEQLTGEKPADVATRAGRNQVSLTPLMKQRAIACEGSGMVELLVSASKGNPKLFKRHFALAFNGLTRNFREQLDQASVAAALNTAFDWAEANADTNPARLEKARLDIQREEASVEHEALQREGTALTREAEELRGQLSEINAQQAEYARMLASGLFTEAEMRQPLKTGQRVGEVLSEAEEKLGTHRVKMAEQTDSFEKWQEFVAEHGDDAQPKAVLERLGDAYETAQAQAFDAKITKDTASEAAENARLEEKAATAALKEISDRTGKLEDLAPRVGVFRSVFGDESPDGLADRVKAVLAAARYRDAEIHTQRTRMREGLEALAAFEAAHGDAVAPAQWLEQRTKRSQMLTEEILGHRHDLADLTARRRDLDTHPVAAGKVAREVLTFAGADAMPLHTAVEQMGLAEERKGKILSLFSALLFSPVYADAGRAAAVASQLAERGIESPVFVAMELEQFCTAGEIAFDGRVASTWLVGVRTRPVDCLLDPTLVEREKTQLALEIEQVRTLLAEKEVELKAMDPNSPAAQQAYKASDAVAQSYRQLDKTLADEQAPLRERLPELEVRASAESIEAIKAVIAHRQVLGDDSIEELLERLVLAKDRHGQAEEAMKTRLDQARVADQASDECHRVVAAAGRELAGAEGDLKQVDAFIQAQGPEFMRTAASVRNSLAKDLDTAKKRSVFRFDAVESFVTCGDQRPKEIQDRLAEIRPEQERVSNDLGLVTKRMDTLIGASRALEGQAREVDDVVRSLRQKQRELVLRDCIPITVREDVLISHPAYQQAAEVRLGRDIEAIVTALKTLNERLGDINAGVISQNLDAARRQFARARTLYHDEIDRVKGSGMALIDEQIKMGLDEAKENLAVLGQLITGTRSIYERSRQANEQAAQYLDQQWSEIGSWLGSFTRRLPTNLDTMKRVFRPRRDPVSGDIVKAGFEIEAKLADMSDVRAVLDGIVQKVEKRERTRETYAEDEVVQTIADKNLRKDIRDEFYRNVIVEPKIRVCLPAISQRPLLLEKDMASSGQGVAMTLLWIVKMADYVTERELDRQSVSAANRKKIRSQRTQFVFIDGAFSHLSDPRLIDDALKGVQESRGKFQLLITGHDPNYQNKWEYFPTYVVAREIGGNMMYADSETRRLLEPEEVGARHGVMELASFRKGEAAAQ
ncbi:hypothetical protein CTP10_R47270 [Cupriavidus sp. P-10]|uniref:hypothetical protein n=1 Tax=Cupriavidus sp. P-10 TaxID=2027911 RepID=UPI000E2FB91D|nr:hypothetical protein [Cupriavidus sp. P-10]BDB27322.1 hypothetical protein CTP10_R47270 [Cupriavidus sp. P-10]